MPRTPAALGVSSQRRYPARSLESMDRKKAYFLLMGTCLLLILLAWNVVRFWSTTAAVVMSAVAAVIPPIAVIVGDWARAGSQAAAVRCR